MKSSFVVRIALGAYLLIFFSYLLGPLVVMSLTAFNSPAFPSVSPWACFTFEWFEVLFNDKHIRDGIYYSVIIGIGTVILSVSMGLAASIVLTQVWPRLRSTYYTMIIAPILIPGVVLGISTLVFWDRVSVFLGATDGSFIHGLFHNGIFLTILGQSTFIASYAMLVFVARLQRFDPGLTEAALDLGATHSQAFRKIMLPFMRPAIASASVLAFLASFENYNTTTFTIIDYKTLTTVLAQKVRLGINPSISSLAFIIIALTVFAALAFEATQRNRQRNEAIAQGRAKPMGNSILPNFMRGNAAAIAFVLLAFAVIVMIVSSQTYSPQMCKERVREARQIEIQKSIDALTAERARKQQQAQEQAPTTEQTTPAPAGNGAFGNVFSPNNLTTDEAAPEPTEPQGGSGAFGNVFAPTNLNNDD
ncbi:ABC transporter permease [Sulfitobacter donghicola]|uniref:Spermidine/putrescine ABC transporter permease n=1 Tax=Sulfitobacter donghicola DSW-25 = KCTC 12864 = JCM 14565 TaxID=1300350 RepID=A0A073IJP1_9RHOB|nr:ABC transporter permease [Sulfitobacter donghicola]KEJ89820.1 spermidine/putrescine ABC transporter permease [Sulfitobacter donghicola DSW-25 = KCTC 12864 = JCM 14565]KIN67060.1 Binding-protein-dependent transport system inner membrane protein [Sulfitobacter donghicola DSW-25 = KCTC 12864 = JCM 14565]